MDAITRAEEINAVLEKTFDTKEVEVKVLRPIRNGSQTATIKLDENKAKTLLNQNWPIDMQDRGNNKLS